ncbi:MAG TPA: TDT family transporter [Candidatus Scatomonas pullistercoris]|uniref:TDT family transporter n=1 Tax=Candidatus Scatomonas pullistercoris TaxID=2840920 RepID=A0A9D1TB39_9FIRM|nr:TDT family transporter [Candidatus Scatomonas pullistercoris]
MKLKIPFSACALALAIASLGNLLGKEIEIGYWICGILAVLLDILWILGRISRPARFREEMARPELASVSGTFSMSLMVLSGYLVSFLRTYAEILWYTGIGLHLGLMVWFTRRFLRPLKTENVYASWFIIYVGIAAAGISSPALGQRPAGLFFCFLGILLFLPALVLILTRYLRLGDPSEHPKRPLFCIFAAPASLCLTGYLQAAKVPDPVLLWGLLGLSLFLWLAVFFRLPILIKRPWHSSCAAFTFPLIISAIAVKKAVPLLELPGMALKVFSAFNFLQSLTAWSLTVLVFCRFLAGLPIRKPRNHFFPETHL